MVRQLFFLRVIIAYEEAYFEYRFGIICYLFARKNDAYAHVTWCVHSSKTYHHELAPPHMLYHLDDSCDDILLSAIYQKCNVQRLAPGEHEPPQDLFTKGNDFALR